MQKIILNKLIVISLLIVNIVISNAQSFTGFIQNESHSRKGQFDKELLFKESKNYPFDTTYMNCTVCKDTLIVEYTAVGLPFGVEKLKSVRIGERLFMKNTIDNYYFEFKSPLDPHPLEQFEASDWKTKGTKGYDYKAVYSKNRNFQYFINIDKENPHFEQSGYKGNFLHFFSKKGTISKIASTNKNYEKITYYKYIASDTLVCRNFLEDYFNPDSMRVEGKDVADWMLRTSSKVIAKKDRVALPFFIAFDSYNIPMDVLEIIGKSRYTYLDLWASWCQPCRAEMPYLSELKDKYAQDNLQVISISLDQEAARDKWLKAIQDLEMNWQNWIIYEGTTSSFYKSFKTTGIPRYILVDEAGKIVNESAPRPSDSDLDSLLEQLLKDK